MHAASAPITVLHVDDDRDFAELAATHLERESDRLTVEVETSASAGLDRLEDVDCVVSDYEMPGMDGIEFLERVREESPDLPFVLYTGKGSEDIASDAIAAGVTDYLQKERGTGQYAVLANRIENAVDRYRSEERAETLARVRRILRDVNQSLVRTRTRDALEERVCETIADADPYAFAWIGVPDANDERVTARTGAGGGSGYLEAIEVDLEDDRLSEGPTARALESGAVVTVQSIRDDPDYDPWREAALERGFASSAAVPIAFEDTTYGVLSVYATEERAFDARERDLLEELGADVGHAIHRIESEQQYRQLFERFPEPTVAVTFADGVPRIDAINPAFEETFGYDAGTAVGRSANDLIVPEDRQSEAERIDRESRREEHLDEEVTRETSEGPRDFLLRNIPIPGETGPDLYWVYVDVTERNAQERALEDLAERLDLALEAGEFGVWDWNVETNEVTYDERWAEMLGYSLEEIEPNLAAWRSRVHPEDREAVEGVLEAYLEGETDHYEFEHRLRTKSGEYRWIRDVGTIVERTEAGDPRRLVGIHQDVTERREREAALERERERFQSLFESFPASVVAVSYADDEPIVEDVNETFESVFGYDVATATGQSLNDLIVPPDRRAEAASLDDRLRERDLIDEEVVREAADGPREFVLRTITLSADHDLDTYAVYIDVSERKSRERAMAALHEAATRLETADSPEAVYDIVIETAEDVLDFALVAVDELEDGALVQRAWSRSQAGDDYYSSTDLEDDTLATRAFRRGETIVADDLREYDITPATSEYRSALTVPIGDRGTFQTVSRETAAFDETDVELAELLVGHAREALDRLDRTRSLEQQRERLQREYDRLDAFVSFLSHDLRNPLTVAEGRIDLARKDPSGEHLDVAADAVDRMREMVEDVLTWAQEGKHVPPEERDPVDLAALTETCWRNVDTGTATVEADTDARILAHEGRLQHVLENLFRNAIEHGSADEGEGQTAEVHVTVGDLPDGFYVADDGRGLQAEDVESLFEVGSTTDSSGTGFGLAIVKEIVEAHEWEIAVTESEAGGARFEITDVDFAE